MKKKKNLGKGFEKVIRESFNKIDNCVCQRLNDNIGFKNAKNPSDFLVYKYPTLYFIECKSHRKNSLPFSVISQFNQLIEKSQIEGVRSGVILWLIDKETTFYIDIRFLQKLALDGLKSVSYDVLMNEDSDMVKIIPGTKKRVYYDYDLQIIFNYK